MFNIATNTGNMAEAESLEAALLAARTLWDEAPGTTLVTISMGLSNAEMEAEFGRITREIAEGHGLAAPTEQPLVGRDIGRAT